MRQLAIHHCEGFAMRAMSTIACLFLVTAYASISPAARAQQQAPPRDPLVRENATVKVSEHVYVIPDFDTPGVPNIGMVVGNRATLVIDTGLGVRNGQTVLREATKVSKTAEMYLAMTHFHPEHDLGAGAFPGSAKLIRSQDQQKDIAEFGLALAKQFASRNAAMAELLKGADFRKADISFDKEYHVDLGGVRVQMFAVGPTHTRGDTVLFIEDDDVLFSGDVVMSAFPALNPSGGSPTSSVRVWLATLDRLEALNPKTIVPSHRKMGNAAMITAYREYFRALQKRSAELKQQGKSVNETAEILQKEIPSKFPDMPNPDRVEAAARVAYAEAP
jgi:glyoxylase-like metal-dependent hydrolase (beta-lactamase superfamily II)